MNPRISFSKKGETVRINGVEMMCNNLFREIERLQVSRDSVRYIVEEFN